MRNVTLLSVLIVSSFFAFTKQCVAQYNKMFIGDNNNGQIIASSIDGNQFDTLTLNGTTYQSFYDADYCPTNQKIYMAWYYGIYSMNVDGSDFDTLVFFADGGYSDGVAVDAANGYIYWGATPDHAIYRSDLAGNAIDTVYTDAGYIGDVDIDPNTGVLYFSKWIFSDKGIYSIDTSGNNLDTIVLGYDAEFIGLNTTAGTVYFSDNTTARRINYDGTNDTLLFNFQPGGFFVDEQNNMLYTSDMTGGNVYSSNLNGENADTLFQSNVLDSPHGPLLINLTTTEVKNGLANEHKIIAYPNPAQDFIMLSSAEKLEGCNYVIMDYTGKQMMKGELTGAGNRISTSNLLPGVYFIKLTGTQNSIIRWIKE